MIQGAQILLVYSGRVFLDSDTESEDREDTTDPAAPGQPPTDAMEEVEQDVSASDSPTSDMQFEDTPPPEVTGKRKRKRRLRRLVRRNGEVRANEIDDRVMAMLPAEPPVNIADHEEMDARELLDSMYLADEERLQEEASTILFTPPPAIAEGTSQVDMECGDTEEIGVGQGADARLVVDLQDSPEVLELSSDRSTESG